MIEIKGISKTYYTKHPGKIFTRKENRVLENVSLNIPRGKTLGLLGKSGCGKSTLARIMLKFVQADSGEILVDGKNIDRYKGKEVRDFRRKVQIVFQDPYSALNEKMTIGGSILEGIRSLLNKRSEEARLQAIAALEAVGLKKDDYDKYPHQFSGGQRQRICLARALAVNPDCIVLDEPVSNLDLTIQAEIVNLLLSVQKERNITYLFISHDVGVVEKMSDFIAVLDRGKIIESGGAQTVLGAPVSDWLKKCLTMAGGKKENGGSNGT